MPEERRHGPDTTKTTIPRDSFCRYSTCRRLNYHPQGLGGRQSFNALPVHAPFISHTILVLRVGNLIATNDTGILGATHTRFFKQLVRNILAKHSSKSGTSNDSGANIWPTQKKRPICVPGAICFLEAAFNFTFALSVRRVLPPFFATPPLPFDRAQARKFVCF